MIQFTLSSRFILYKADPIFYPTCDLEQEGKLAICNFRPVVTGQQAAQAGDTEEKIAPRVTRRLRPSQLRPEIEDSNNQTRSIQLSVVWDRTKQLQPENSSQILKTQILFQFYRERLTG